MKNTIALATTTALHAIANITSTDETRYVLNGVCFDIKVPGLRCIATDGRKMIIHRPDWEMDFADHNLEYRFVVPAAAIDLLPREEERLWKLEFDPEQPKRAAFVYHDNELRIEFATIDGSYPSNQQIGYIIPETLPEAPPPQGVMVAVDFEHFGGVMKTLELLETRNKGVRVSRDGDGPIYFVTPRTTIALMPMKS